MSITVDKLTKTYIKIREKRSELSTEYKQQDGVLSEQLDRIKKALLSHCKEHAVDSVRTSEGLFYRSVKQRYWTSDWESMNAFIMEHDVPHFYEKRLNQTSVKQFLEDHPDLVPKGLNVDSEYTVAVRKK
jgi:hypothetical protein|tara:strand:+ start:2179 stop:2568 length:390 start_codon:yes stop_codon:yes gene_type:complete